MKTNTRGTGAGETQGTTIGGAVGRRLWRLARMAGRASGLRGVGGAAVVAGLLSAAAATSVIAGPEGEQVIVGNVTFTRQGNLWIITASNGAIINYASFDILPYETVRFIQPSQLSTVLNRINSAAPTLIQGRLEANGNVFFVNPAGVIFTNTSTVNVGGLYAAAGNLSNEDFLAGNMRFTGLQGRVENSGNIAANAVALVGKEVANHGSIIAHGGTVVMAAGEEVFIGREGSSVFTQIQGAAGGSGEGAVTNTGRIDARGGQVSMSAGDADGMAIFNTGVIRGNAITIEGQGTGDVIVKGHVDASNDAGRGGTITITGERVGIFDARIDASGTWGGGTIHIGGDAGGQGDIRRADYVFVDQTSVISADAHEFGDGGRITFWGTEATRIAGSISAMGGIHSGNGGFIETSGGYIALGGTPELRARSASGRGGHWVIDPNDITIVAGGGNTNINAADPFASTDDGAQLGVDLITAALGNGVSVSITTTTGGADTELGNITFATDLIYTGTGDATLTLNAHNDIVFNAGTVVSGSVAGGLNLVFNSDSDNDGSGSVLLNNAVLTLNGGSITTSANVEDFTMSAGGQIDTGGGAMTLNNTGNNTLAQIDLGAGAFTSATTGLTTLTGSFTGGSLDITGAAAINGGSVTTTGNVTFGDTLTVQTDSTISAGGTVTFQNTVDAGGAGIDFSVTSTGTTVNAAFGGTTAFETLTFGGGPITLLADVTTAGAQAYNDAVVIGAASVTLTSTGAGAITFASTVDGDVAGRSLTVNTGGDTTFTGNVGATQALSNLTTDAAGAVILSGTLTLDNTGTIDGSAISLGGDILATNMTFGGPVTLTNNVTINVVNVTFSGTVDADDEANNRQLVIDLSVGGVASFDSTVGATARLDTLTVNDAGAGLTILTGNVSTLGAQVYQSVVQINGDLTIAGTNITFGSSVDADAAGNNRALTISTTGGSTVTFTGAVGGSQSLGSLTVTDDAAGTTIISNSITTSGAQTFDENVTLAADVTFLSSGGGAILFGGTVDSDGVARALTADTAGTITFTGAVGGTSELSTLTTLNGTTVIAGGLVNTSTLQSYGGAVNITANTTLVSDEIDFNGNVTGTGFTLAFETFTGGANIELGGAGGTGALDLTSAELAFLQDGFAGLTFGDASMVGSILVAGPITLTDATTFLVDTGNGGTIRLAGNVTVNDVANAATITFSGPVILEGDITVASTGVGANGDIIFGETINADAAGNNRILTVNSQGAVTFTGAVGGVEALGGLVTDAGGSTRITTDITTVAAGNQTYGDNVVLLGNATLTGNNISFDGTINADAAANNRDLIVNGAGAITFSGVVGGTEALNSLTTGGAGTVSILAAITTAGAQLYNNAVTINSSQLTGGSVTFGSTVDASAAGQDLLVTSTAGDIVFSSTIGATTAFRDITTSAAATFANRLGGNVTADRNITLGGASVITNSITMTSERMSFGTTLDADGAGRTLTLTSTATTGSAATPLFRFGGNVGSTVAFQTITFSAVSFADPAFSTILFAPTSPFGGDGSVAFGNTISINADTIDFQDGHRVTALANFTINAVDLTVGDITSAGNLNINVSNMITIRVRDGGRSETAPGTGDNGLDLGADWVALGSITANGGVQFDDGGVISGTIPGGRQFSLATGQGGVVSGTATTGFAATTLALTPQFASALFDNGGNFLSLDLTAKTTLDQPPIAGLTPRIEVDAVSTPQPVTSELAEFMRSLDMSLKDELSIDDQLEALIGRALYIDMANPEHASAKDRYRVTRERLTTENVKPLRDTFRAVFQREDGVRDDGSPNFVDDSKRVRDTLGKAWKSYQTTTDKPDGIGFRRFLEADQANTDNSAALEILDGMGVLFEQIDRLGLSEFEAIRPKNSIINRALSPDIGTNDAARQILRDAILGEQLEEEVDGMAMIAP